MIFIFLLITFLAGVFIFLTFSNIYCVMKSESFTNSIKRSIFLVKKNYFSVLFISLFFFAVNWIVNIIPNQVISESINSILILPYMALVLSKFLIDSEKR